MDKIEIEKIIENLWQRAPDWANYIAIDFDGFVSAFENKPYPVHVYEPEWVRTHNATNLNRVYSMECIDAEFPNWDELIFERSAFTTQPINSENNPLTPLLQKLRNYLDTTPRQQIDSDWAQVKSLGLSGSPNCEEFIKTFKS